MIMPDGPGWAAGLWCLTAVLLPSLLLVLGTLPYWQQLRQNPSAQAALSGANAAVVGILLAAFYHPVWTAAIDSLQAMILALAAFCALQFWRCRLVGPAAGGTPCGPNFWSTDLD